MFFGHTSEQKVDARRARLKHGDNAGVESRYCPSKKKGGQGISNFRGRFADSGLVSAQGDDRIDVRGTQRREQTRERRNDGEQSGHHFPTLSRLFRFPASDCFFFRLNGCMKQTLHDPETLREEVRRRYGSIAKGDSTLKDSDKPEGGCCSPGSSGNTRTGCCGVGEQAYTLGYSDADLAGIPDGANLGLGCGNPVALASLQPGQTVLDLGAGAGFDAFIAARAVGPTGRVIGIDMTSEMVSKARANAKKGGYTQVDFRLGEIEALPVADASVDVIISNCVINLCPDKRPVYQEAFRALRPGGRLAVSDVVARAELPDEVKQDLSLHSGCLAGATAQADLVRILEEVGFADIVIRAKGNSDDVITSWDSKRGFESKVFAAEVTATKPAAACCGPTCCN